MNDRLIRVQGHGSATQVPDSVAIAFHIRVKDLEFQEALRLLEEKVRTLQEHMRKAKVASKDLTTTRFGVDATFVTKGKQQVFDGYVASHSVRLEVPWEKDHLALILQRLAEITEGVEFGLSFFVKDVAGLRNKALTEAAKQAKENASTIANAAGVQLGTIVSIDYGWTEVRFESDFRLKATEAMAGPEINPDTVDHEESVTMAWSIAD